MKVANLQKIGYVTNLPRENYFNRNMRRLKRAVIIGSVVLGTLAFAGKTMAQDYDPQKILNPSYVRTVAEKYFAIPEQARITLKETEAQGAIHFNFNTVFLGAQEERETNPNLSLFNERMTERERVFGTGTFTPQEDEQYHFGFTNVYVWFLENRTLPPVELRAKLDQKIEQELGALFRKFEPPKKQEPLQPLTLGANQ